MSPRGKANGCITVALQNDFGARDAIGADYDVYTHRELEQTLLQLVAQGKGAIDMSSKEILKEFMLTSAPSGYESEMAYKLKAHLEQYCPEVTLDRVGNVIAKVTGTDPSLPRPIFGHLDSWASSSARWRRTALSRWTAWEGSRKRCYPGWSW